MAVWYRSHLIPFGLALVAFLIITTGGWIRISDAGESCPDWPQCFGTWGFDISEEEQAQWWEENPDEIDSRGAQHRYTTDQIFTEWAHRGLVAIIGVLVIYSHYTAWSLKDKIGTRTYRTHYIASVFLVLQAILGAITVNLDNAPWTVSLHLFMALVFTTSLLAVGFFWWQGQEGLPENLKVKNRMWCRNSRMATLFKQTNTFFFRIWSFITIRASIFCISNWRNFSLGKNANGR